MCAPERTTSRAKASRVHTVCAQYRRHDCCIHRWTHWLPSMSSSPLAPKHTTTRTIPSRPWGLLRHSAPAAVGYCCFYCYSTRGWDRLAQIIVNQGETRKHGGIHTRVLAGRGQAVEMGCRQAAPFRSIEWVDYRAGLRGYVQFNKYTYILGRINASGIE